MVVNSKHFALIYLCFRVYLCSREKERQNVLPISNWSKENGNYKESVVLKPNLAHDALEPKLEHRHLDKSTLPHFEITEKPIRNFDTQPDDANMATANKCNYFDNSRSSSALTIRKCCQEKEFFNSETHECETITDSAKFKNEIRKFSKIPNNAVMNIFSKMIDECHPKIIDLDHSYDIIGTGQIYDCSLNLKYNVSEYCLEMSGSELETSVLWLVYCPRTIPKCCSKGYYFDKRSHNCIQYRDRAGGSDFLLHPYFSKAFKLEFSNLLCDQHLPVEVILNEAALHGNTLCLPNYDQCYNWNEYCIENIGQEGSSEMVQEALICPKVIIYKCCPDGQLLHYGKCVKFGQQSPQLTHILKTNIYKVESVEDRGVECEPILIYNNTNLEIFWLVDSDGNALIGSQNFVAQNLALFCVEDFLDSLMGVTPALRVCSEDLKSELLSGKVLQKCCPAGMVYLAEAENGTDRCVFEPNIYTNLLETEQLQRLNISHFQMHKFPENCSDLFSYDFGPLDTDGNYVELTNVTSLKITNKQNNCTTKETTIVTLSTFCVDYRVQNDSYRPVVLVCNHGLSSTYVEKIYIIGCLTALSCGFLAFSLVKLATTRVRRGMITVRKVNTLAGKILISYVFCQLFGYALLGFLTVWSFSEKNNSCFILSGILQFSSIAAFCWNTAICLEGLLLTMEVRTSEQKRYLYHSIWAWGIPGIITAITLTIDSHRDSYPCGAITPQIGVQRCFFSDFRAMLLYLYLPISFFVLLNAIFLLSSKALRQIQLKKLEQGHANFCSKNVGTAPSAHTDGLRTHQTKNMWIESLKLVIWSGITWLLEMVGTAVTIKDKGAEGEWFNYLWYIPLGANCLRGLGIFLVISVTPEQQTKLCRLIRFW